MKKLTIKQAKDYWEIGAISGFEAVRFNEGPENPEWAVKLLNRGDEFWWLVTAKGMTKMFSSLDTLYGQMLEIEGNQSREYERLIGFFGKPKKSKITEGEAK